MTPVATANKPWFSLARKPPPNAAAARFCYRCHNVGKAWPSRRQSRVATSGRVTAVPLNRRRRLAPRRFAAGRRLAGPARAADPGLLFRLSADKSLTADVAGGDPVPNFADKAKIVPDGVKGGALSAADDVVLAWKAPGNIYAQRGTLSLLLAQPLSGGRGALPDLPRGLRRPHQLGHGWLRIDWNGARLRRLRHRQQPRPHPRLASNCRRRPPPTPGRTWPSPGTRPSGIELYVDGKLAAKTGAQPARLGHRPRPVRPHQPRGLARTRCRAATTSCAAATTTSCASTTTRWRRRPSPPSPRPRSRGRRRAARPRHRRRPRRVVRCATAGTGRATPRRC